MERFWEKVDIRGVDDCWEWQGAKTQDGYGIMGGNNWSSVGAHRISYMIHHGEPPIRSHILHSCHTRSCVNPAHLRPGSPAENMADKVALGRVTAGEMNHHAKLTEDDVREIRRRAAEGEARGEIAADYGLHRASVNQIVRRSRWKHVV